MASKGVMLLLPLPSPHHRELGASVFKEAPLQGGHSAGGPWWRLPSSRFRERWEGGKRPPMCIASQGLLALNARWWELPLSVPRGLASQEACRPRARGCLLHSMSTGEAAAPQPAHLHPEGQLRLACTPAAPSRLHTESTSVE